MRHLDFWREKYPKFTDFSYIWFMYVFLWVEKKRSFHNTYLTTSGYGYYLWSLKNETICYFK